MNSLRLSRSDGPVVLLVQPERDDRDMYAEYLSYKGWIPLCVQDAGAALTLAPRADVIVTGLLLPGAMDGHSLIHRLRKGGHPSRTDCRVDRVCVDRRGSASEGCGLRRIPVEA